MNGPKDFLKLGSMNVICDRCGFKYKSEELKKEWQGFMVCSSCFEPRHPQDMIRAVPDQQLKPYYRPEPELEFIVNASFGVNDNETTIFYDDGSPTMEG